MNARDAGLELSPLGVVARAHQCLPERRKGALEIVVDGAAPAPVTIRFIGGGGRVLREVKGHAARLDLGAAAGAYVRAEVVDARGARAWVQPVWP